MILKKNTDSSKVSRGVYVEKSVKNWTFLCCIHACVFQGGDDPYVFNTYGDIVIVPDPEISMENLVENKHHKLARSLRSGPTDRDMKPDAKTRDILNVRDNIQKNLSKLEGQ